MATAFDDVQLPVNIEQGAIGGPNFFTTVVEFSSGQEQRNANWSRARGNWTIGYGMQYQADYEGVRDFFYARNGRFRGFRFKDWTDFQTTSEPVATATSGQTVFQLVRNYLSGGINFIRPITRPVSGTVVVYDNGVSVAFTLGALGIITLTTPATAGDLITADFQFDVPVRFDQDNLDLTVTYYTSGEYPSIKIKELIE